MSPQAYYNEFNLIIKLIYLLNKNSVLVKKRGLF